MNNSKMFKNWSPISKRKLFSTEHKQLHKNEDLYNLYPNCDANIWLRSCGKEILDPIEGFCTGKIPDWLNGVLYRNGPGSIKVGGGEFNHLFDSSALIHRFCIKTGKITYQCRFVQSNVYKKNREAKRIVVSEFGTAAVPDPCQSIFKRISSIFDSNNQSDNTMISIYPFGDEIYAFTETPIIHKINKMNLDTESTINVGRYVSIVNHTSHPHVTKGGDVFNLGMSVTITGLKHTIVKFPISERNNGSMFEKAHIVASVPSRWTLNPSYMHTFGITENYFVIVEQPLSISIPSVFSSKLQNKPMIGNFKWYKDEMTQFHVIDRNTGQTAYKFYSEPFFFLHIINQFESDGHIVIDICCYRDPSMLDCMYIEIMKGMQNNPDYAKMFRARPFRFILPLNINNNNNKQGFFQSDDKIFIEPELICDLGCETPRINYDNYLGKEYRYFYAISSDVDAANPGTIIKVDTKTKTARTWCETNCYPSEPVFVPKPNSQDEDDGVILSSIVWGAGQTNRVGLLVLDAKTFTELSRSEFETPSEAPKCLHGWFIQE